MITYAALNKESFDKWVEEHKKENNTKALATFLYELGYGQSDIERLLANQVTRDCVEINLRSCALRNHAIQEAQREVSENYTGMTEAEDLNGNKSMMPVND